MQVHYGVKGGNLTQFAEATSDTYTAADLCGAIANASGYIYPGAPLPPSVRRCKASAVRAKRDGKAKRPSDAVLTWLGLRSSCDIMTFKSVHNSVFVIFRMRPARVSQHRVVQASSTRLTWTTWSPTPSTSTMSALQLQVRDQLHAVIRQSPACPSCVHDS